MPHRDQFAKTRFVSAQISLRVRQQVARGVIGYLQGQRPGLCGIGCLITSIQAATACRYHAAMNVDFAQALCTTLQTTRLRLEPLTGAHADSAFAPLQDDAIYEWISMHKPRSVESLRENWEGLESRMAPGGSQAWPIWAVRSADHGGAVIGQVDAVVDRHRAGTNFGYYFFPAYWGQGLASEAVQLASDHLLQHGVTHLIATVTVGHAASARVLRKAGFAFNRVIVDNDTLRGVLVNDEEYIRTA